MTVPIYSLTLACALLFGSGISKPHAETTSTVVAAGISQAEAQQDFDLLRLALEEAHPGLYRYSAKSEMDRMFDNERKKLNSTTKIGFMTVIAETLGAIRCGHTSFQPDDETKTAVDAALKFPLRTLIEGKKLMVLFNDTPDDKTIQPGMEILEINGRSVVDIIGRIWPMESADGDIESGKRQHVQSGFGLYYWLLFEQTRQFKVKAQTSEGKIVTATLTGVTQDDRKRNQNPVNAIIKEQIAKLNWSDGNQSLRFLKDPDIAEIRLRYFVGDDYPQWIESTFKTLKENGTKALIIDLRGNGGGQDMYGALLVAYLTDQPFRYFDHINLKCISPSFKDHCDWNTAEESKLREQAIPNPAGGYLVTANMHPGVAEQPPGKYPYLGKVFVLIDGGTFSTAADFCAVTHHLKRATFVGEETGGGYYGNNSGMQTMVLLPNSKLSIRLPMGSYWNAVPGYEGKRRGTIPNHIVETRIADLLLGVDAPLDMALRLATKELSSK